MKTSRELDKIEFQELREIYEHMVEFTKDSRDNTVIPDEEIHKFYEGTYFIEDDFFCNLNN